MTMYHKTIDIMSSSYQSSSSAYDRPLKMKNNFVQERNHLINQSTTIPEVSPSLDPSGNLAPASEESLGRHQPAIFGGAGDSNRVWGPLRPRPGRQELRGGRGQSDLGPADQVGQHGECAAASHLLLGHDLFNKRRPGEMIHRSRVAAVILTICCTSHLNAVVFFGVVTDFNRSGGSFSADGLWAALHPTFLSLAIGVPPYPESQSGQVREGGVL